MEGNILALEILTFTDPYYLFSSFFLKSKDTEVHLELKSLFFYFDKKKISNGNYLHKCYYYIYIYVLL